MLKDYVHIIGDALSVVIAGVVCALIIKAASNRDLPKNHLIQLNQYIKLKYGLPVKILSLFGVAAFIAGCIMVLLAGKSIIGMIIASAIALYIFLDLVPEMLINRLSFDNENIYVYTFLKGHRQTKFSNITGYKYKQGMAYYVFKTDIGKIYLSEYLIGHKLFLDKVPFNSIQSI